MEFQHEGCSGLWKQSLSPPLLLCTNIDFQHLTLLQWPGRWQHSKPSSEHANPKKEKIHLDLLFLSFKGKSLSPKRLQEHHLLRVGHLEELGGMGFNQETCPPMCPLKHQTEEKEVSNHIFIRSVMLACSSQGITINDPLFWQNSKPVWSANKVVCSGLDEETVFNFSLQQHQQCSYVLIQRFWSRDIIQIRASL